MSSSSSQRRITPDRNGTADEQIDVGQYSSTLVTRIQVRLHEALQKRANRWHSKCPKYFAHYKQIGCNLMIRGTENSVSPHNSRARRKITSLRMPTRVHTHTHRQRKCEELGSDTIRC